MKSRIKAIAKGLVPKSRKARFLYALSGAVLALLIGSYLSGLRIATFTPDNAWVCEGNLDGPADYSPSPISDAQKIANDAEFEKYCPGFKSGWFWGQWAITKPRKEPGFDVLFVGQFWRPYYGSIWPDNNLGKRSGVFFGKLTTDNKN